MRNTIILIICTLFFISNTWAQNRFANWNDSTLTLNNGVVERIIALPKSSGSFFTQEYKPINGTFRYFKKESDEFSFLINDVFYTGRTGWKLVKIVSLTDDNDGNGAAVILVNQDKKIQLTVNFLLYANTPFIRKSLAIKNLTANAVSPRSA